MKKAFLICLILQLSLLFANSNKAVRMEVETKEILESESFELSIILENFEPNKLTIQQPDFDKDLKRIQGPFQSQSTSVINGDVTKSLTLTYLFMPKRSGEIQIPAVIIKDDGKVFQSNTLSLKIVKAGDKSGEANKGNQLFIQASISNSKPYLGEMVKLDYTLFIPANARIRLPSISEDPRVQGFLTDQKSTNQQSRNLVPQIYNGVRYNTLLIKSTWLTASSAGKQTIAPLVLKVPLEEKAKKKKRKTAFDDPFFDDDLFAGYNTFNDQIVSSRTIPVEIKELPAAGRPAGFNGAVGSFKFSSSVNTTSVKANEAITIKTVIEGTGNFNDLVPPKFNIPDDFEIYDPTIKKSSNGAPNSGKIVIEQICIPRIAGLQKISGSQFSFFSPASGRYETISPATFEIDVKPGNGVAYNPNNNPSITQKEINVVGNDIRYIKKESGEFFTKSNRNFTFSNFYLWILLILILPLTSYFSNLYYEKNSQDNSLKRRKKASAFANKKLKVAIKLANQGKTADFYQNLETTFYHYLADKFNISHTGIVLEDIITQLHDRGTSDAILTNLRELLNKCASIRYTPAAELAKDILTDLEKSKTLINDLEDSIK